MIIDDIGTAGTMTIDVASTVFKEVEKLPEYVRDMIDEQLDILEKAKILFDVPNVTKMQGTKEPYYRLRFGNYRMMMYYEVGINKLEVLSVKHRKDSYKKHNLPWYK